MFAWIQTHINQSDGCCSGSYHEEGHGAPPVDGAVLDVGLVGQVVRRLDGDLHPLDGQEGCQVGRVGRDDDQGESPPVRRREGEELGMQRLTRYLILN